MGTTSTPKSDLEIYQALRIEALENEIKRLINDIKVNDYEEVRNNQRTKLPIETISNRKFKEV